VLSYLSFYIDGVVASWQIVNPRRYAIVRIIDVSMGPLMAGRELNYQLEMETNGQDDRLR
jgi:hypothetical protein